VAKKIVRLGISEAFPWAWTWFQVLRGPEEVRTGREVQGTPGGHIGPVTGDWADDRGAGRGGRLTLANANHGK
jgi:hypothetical protein